MPRLADKRLGPMIFWSIAIAVTAIACAALFYAAAGRTVNETTGEMTDQNRHFRLALDAIEADERNGKLDASQALAAKGELAREILRNKAAPGPAPAKSLGQAPLLSGLAVTAALSLVLYAFLGRPDLPAQPLADRPELVAQSLDLDDAVARIEARLIEAPDDLRGWQVIAPAYVEMGRFADAAEAYRRVMALSGPSADLRTDLAEALLLDANGAGSDEAMDQLEQAAAADPDHVRSRLYLAAEFMRLARYDQARTYWQQAINLAQGNESWLPAARQGLAVAANDGVDTTAADQAEMIQGMVGGLADRLYAEGGSVEEWTQLVRSYLVLNDRDNAQRAYDAAVVAYPAAFDRGELDTLALDAGLTLNGDDQ
ncbi:MULTISPECIES: c-type cytochrome biogenesis protein CcmI [Devosia]|uniref:c-type cytochrome biogenesis protein CcmI n=1 Tax=Devosia TaxID=46913 RepID=UPI0013003605|nr:MULTISPECIES: c-type cytochrome biogenesis protein CcmI [Devosia]